MPARPAAAAVPNDSIAHAKTIAVGATGAVDMAQATADELIDVWASDACGFDEFGWVSSVWYAFTPHHPGVYHVDATPTLSQGLSVVVVTDPAEGSRNLRECGLRKTSFPAVAGQTYYIGFATDVAEVKLGFSLGRGSIQPEAAVRYVKSAVVKTDGSVLVRGFYRCRRTTFVEVVVQMGQDPVASGGGDSEFAIRAEGSAEIPHPRCNNRWHRWMIRHASSDEAPDYHRGRATVTALSANIAWCDEIGCVAPGTLSFRGGPILLRSPR